MIPDGREFFKMSGSGNDFVFVDARSEPAAGLTDPGTVEAVCGRGTGIGADGIVLLETSADATVGIRYLNSDGSLASFCGNATLCATRLAVELGAAPASGFTVETGAGVVQARIRDGAPEIDLPPVTEIRGDAGLAPAEGERRIGFALVGVPHLVVLVDDLEATDVVGRGRPLRRDPSLRQGANVNFVAPDESAPGGFRVRTYERGVEGETLACGSGAVATAILLTEWGLATGPVRLQTRSGRTLTVRLQRAANGWRASLAGEGRVVFRGRFAELGLRDGDSSAGASITDVAAPAPSR